MAIYGIGTDYEGNDISELFIAKGIACINWCVTDAPALHQIMHYMKIGDIVYIKSYSLPNGLYIKAVGIVTDNETKDYPEGKGVKVKWIWKGYDPMGIIHEKNNVRNNAIYEEFNKEVQGVVIDHLLSRTKPLD